MIVSAALDLIEADGLARLSARKLAARLGCEAMSLYNHISSMADLYDAIVDHLLGSLPPIGIGQEAVRLGAQEYLQLAVERPNAFVLIATRRWRTENAIKAAAIFVASFKQNGQSDSMALRHARILGAYLNGTGLALAAWRKDCDEDTVVKEVTVRADLEHGLDQMLATLFQAKGN